MLRLLHWLILAACLSGPVFAQEEVIEVFPVEGPSEPGLTSWHQSQAVQFQRLVQSIETLPPVAAAWFALTSEDRREISRANAIAAPGAPEQTGFVRSVGIAVDFSAVSHSAMSRQQAAFSGGWLRRNETGGIVWSLRLDIENAGAVRLHLTDLSLPEGVDLYLFNDEGDVFGPYGGKTDSLWTHSISGERVYLQMDDRTSGYAVLEEARFQIKEVALIKVSPQAHCPINASCVEDATCFGTSEWANIDLARRAIAWNSYIKEDGRTWGTSGGLVNDSDPNTFVPYLLTANHSISTQATASTVETWFDYQTSSCGAPCPARGTRSTLGATLLSTSTADDHTLLRLNEPPPSGRIFLGWTTADIANSTTTLYRLSHPMGSPLAYSRHRVTPTGVTCAGAPRGRYIYSQNEVGATERGSSGSPLMNENGQIVGQLLGLCAPDLNNACDFTNNRNMDGALRNYYSQVAQWLNPSGVILSVNRAGAGTGTVTSTPAGIHCGTGCSAAFAPGTLVTLTAVPAWGSSFAGWYGDCFGTSTCTVTMDAARSVLADFAMTPPDTTPDPFAFPSRVGVTPGSVVTSDPVTPRGYNAPAPVTVSHNGEYSVDCDGVFTSASGVIKPAQSVCVRHTASIRMNTTVSTTLTIGGVSSTFSSTTAEWLALPNAVSVTDLAGDEDSQQFFSIEVPEGSERLIVTITGGSGDADLYLGFGALPSTEEYLCRPFLWGNEETCEIEQPSAGTYYIMLRGFQAFEGVALTATFFPPTCDYDDQTSLHNMVLMGTHTYAACRTLTAGPNLLVSEVADVTLVSGERIAFRPGVAIRVGAVVRAKIDTSLQSVP